VNLVQILYNLLVGFITSLEMMAPHILLNSCSVDSTTHSYTHSLLHLTILHILIYIDPKPLPNNHSNLIWLVRVGWTQIKPDQNNWVSIQWNSSYVNWDLIEGWSGSAGSLFQVLLFSSFHFISFTLFSYISWKRSKNDIEKKIKNEKWINISFGWLVGWLVGSIRGGHWVTLL
jgi:hypothetical protein